MPHLDHDIASGPPAPPGSDLLEAPQLTRMKGGIEDVIESLTWIKTSSSLAPYMADQPGTSTPLAAGLGTNGKSKVTFSEGQTVAFRPGPVSGEQSDWILGQVSEVLAEGYSRRYKVIDIEPDDSNGHNEFRVSASSIIPIASKHQGANLQDWVPGTVVLALYPDTTTFYKAEVRLHSQTFSGVPVVFEGEDGSRIHNVERRFVIEYRS